MFWGRVNPLPHPLGAYGVSNRLPVNLNPPNSQECRQVSGCDMVWSGHWCGVVYEAGGCMDLVMSDDACPLSVYDQRPKHCVRSVLPNALNAYAA